MTLFSISSVGRRLVLGSFICLLSHAVLARSPNKAWLKDFQALTEEIIQYRQPPGVAVAIVTPSQVLSIKTHGVRELGKAAAIDEGTIFRVASISKTCTSALVSQLAAQGRIDIEAPITRYLPNIQVASSEHTQQLKVKHLLSHTTGLPERSLENEAYRRQDLETLVKQLRSVKAVSKPGKTHRYQNVLYSLLGPVIESVTKTSFTDHLQRALLEPLGITNYALREADYASCENVAKPHLRTKRRTASNLPSYKVCQPTSYYDNILPAGGMGFSVKDMAKLLQAFMSGYPVVLEDKILKECHTPIAFVSKGAKGCKKQQCDCKKYITEHYGLGWRVRHFKGKPIIYHRGELKGYTAQMAFSSKEQIGIIVLANVDKSSMPYQICNTFFHMLFDKDHQRPARFRDFKLNGTEKS